MRGIMTFPHHDHYRPTIATWLCNLCTIIWDLTGEKWQSKLWYDIAMSFKGLRARFHSQSRTGGGAYLWYLCRNFGWKWEQGLYARGGIFAGHYSITFPLAAISTWPYFSALLQFFISDPYLYVPYSWKFLLGENYRHLFSFSHWQNYFP